MIHPSFYKLGLKINSNENRFIDPDLQCLLLIEAFESLLLDSNLPAEDDVLIREIENVMKPGISFISGGRPLPPSLANLVKQLKSQLTLDHQHGSSNKVKDRLLEWLRDFAEQKIQLATKSICVTFAEKLKAFNDSKLILTFSNSILVQEIFAFACSSGCKFEVVVVDSVPRKEGLTLAAKLIDLGIECRYTLITGVGHVIDSVQMLLMGADGMLANGAAVCPLGTSQLCMLARARNIPVMVACQTYKFCEKVQTAAVEPGWAEKEVVPTDFITGVITELRTLPCSSVPAVLRVKQP